MADQACRAQAGQEDYKSWVCPVTEWIQGQLYEFNEDAQNRKFKKGWGYNFLVGCLPGMDKTLGSISNACMCTHVHTHTHTPQTCAHTEG